MPRNVRTRMSYDEDITYLSRLATSIRNDEERAKDKKWVASVRKKISELITILQKDPLESPSE